MKKGFTLIELLGVIVILGIIAMIAIPTINSAINNSKEKAYDTQVNIILEAARNYMVKNPLELPDKIAGSQTTVTITILKNNGLLTDSDILNPNYKKGSTIDKQKCQKFNGTITITYTNNKYKYTYTEATTC
jgi:type IV pilus assembly protein PilA